MASVTCSGSRCRPNAEPTCVARYGVDEGRFLLAIGTAVRGRIRSVHRWLRERVLAGEQLTPGAVADRAPRGGPSASFGGRSAGGVGRLERCGQVARVIEAPYLVKTAKLTAAQAAVGAAVGELMCVQLVVLNRRVFLTQRATHITRRHSMNQPTASPARVRGLRARFPDCLFLQGTRCLPPPATPAAWRRPRRISWTMCFGRSRYGKGALFAQAPALFRPP